MEKAFIVSKESEYYKDLHNYFDLCEEQREFVDKFFDENNIKSNEYRVGGDGSVNTSFSYREQDSITLSIIPTEEDLNLYGKSLTKSDENGLCKFKKNSKIAKLFADECVDKRIVVNLYAPRLADYITNSYHGCKHERLVYKDTMYLRVISDNLIENTEEKGFKEIKMSEYYSIKEKFESENKED